MTLSQAAFDAAVADLPEHVRRVLKAFVDSATAALADDLTAIILFGSAAEGKLRETSDINVLVVMKRLSGERMKLLHAPLRLAHAAIELNVMFVLDDEIETVAEAFAVKFLDMHARHRVLVGSDPLAGLSVPPEAIKRRLRQVLVNLSLRLRERYAAIGDRDQWVVWAVADAAGPLRSAASAILSLEGTAAPSPAEALEMVCGSLPGEGWGTVVDALAEAQGRARVTLMRPATTLLRLIDLCAALRRRAGV